MGRLLLICFCTLAFSFAAFGEARGADLENPQRELDVFKELTAYNRFRAKEADYIRILDVIKSTRGIPEYDAADILTSASSKNFAKAEAKVKETLERLKARAEKGDEWAQVALLIYERKNNPPNAENDKKLIEFAERGNASASYALLRDYGYYEPVTREFKTYEFNFPSEDMRLKFEKTAREGGLLKPYVESAIRDSNLSSAKNSEAVELVEKTDIDGFYVDDIASVAQFYIDVRSGKNYRKKALDLLLYGIKRNNVSSAVKLALIYLDGSEALGIEKCEGKVEEIANSLDERLKGDFYFCLYLGYDKKYGRWVFYYDLPAAKSNAWRIEKFKKVKIYAEKAAECGNLEAEFMCAMSLLNDGIASDDLRLFLKIEKLPLEKQREFIAKMSALESKVAPLGDKDASLKSNVYFALALFYLKAHESLRDEQKAVSILESKFSDTYAIRALGFLHLIYREGFCVAKDEAKAGLYLDKYIKSGREVKYLYSDFSNLFSKTESVEFFNAVAPKSDELSQKYRDLCFDMSDDGIEEANFVNDLMNKSRYEEAKRHLERLAVKKLPGYYDAGIRYYRYIDKQKYISLLLERFERHPNFHFSSSFDDDEFAYAAIISGAYGFKKDKAAAEAYLEKCCNNKLGEERKADHEARARFRRDFLEEAFEYLCEDSMGLDSDKRIEVLNEMFDEIKDESGACYDFASFYLNQGNIEKAISYAKPYVLKERNMFPLPIYYKKTYSPELKKMAIEMLKFSAEHNVPEGLLILSALHREGRFVEKNADLADELLAKVDIERLDSKIRFHLQFGLWLWGDSLETLYKYDLRRAECGDPSAQANMMLTYMGYGPYTSFAGKNEAKVFEYAEKLEDKRDIYGMLLLHIFYDRGISPFKKDEERAKRIADIYEAILINEEPPFFGSISREILWRNAYGDIFFEGDNDEYALRMCEEAEAFSGVELRYLLGLVCDLYTDRAKYFSRAMGILEKASENGNYKARQYYVEGQICEALRKKDYALALKIIEENSELKINDTAYLIKIALHLSEENSPLGKSAVEKICAKPHWASDVESCLKYDKYELRDEENLIKRVNALFVGQKDTRDFSKIEPFVRRVTNPEYKRIDLKKYYK